MPFQIDATKTEFSRCHLRSQQSRNVKPELKFTPPSVNGASNLRGSAKLLLKGGPRTSPRVTCLPLLIKPPEYSCRGVAPRAAETLIYARCNVNLSTSRRPAERGPSLFCCCGWPASKLTAHLRFFSLHQNFNTCAFCVAVWVSHVRRPLFVKRKSPIQSLVCVWERGSALSHSAGGKLLSFSFGSCPICISCHPPFSFLFLSRRLRSRTESAGSSKLKREPVKNSAPSRRQPPRLNSRPKDLVQNSADYVVCGSCWSAVLPSSDRLLVLIRFHLKKKIKNGTHLRGKADETGAGKAETERNVWQRGKKTWNKETDKQKRTFESPF